jgi:hypothetical protein
MLDQISLYMIRVPSWCRLIFKFLRDEPGFVCTNKHLASSMPEGRRSLTRPFCSEIAEILIRLVVDKSDCPEV